jgi:glycine/D-amino acid oxidase-like deaminating enzyme/nitrite reductase/ring-hydroxylating ferredoxin subunit
MYDSQRTNGDYNPGWYQDLTPTELLALDTSAGSWPTKPLDLIVVGGGMAGLSIAYHACSRGQSVMVIDRGMLGSGETGRTTAHLSSALDDRYVHLERLHGRRGAELAATSHCAAINDIERIVREESIACGFRRIPGYLFSAKSGRAGVRELLKEREAAQRARLAVEIERSPKVALSDGPCLRFERQADFHPLSYLAGLARAIARMGARIVTRTRVFDVDPDQAMPSVILADGRSLLAKAVVVATNSPINDRFAMHTKQAAYRSYVLTFEIPQGSVEPALYWDTSDPYHYVRMSSAGDKLIVGGEDHRVGQSNTADARFSQLESWTRSRFPTAALVTSRWSGQIQEPADGMAFIGRNPGSRANVFIVTGDSGNGITHGAIAGMLINDLIAEQSNPWESLYDPSRRRQMLATSDFVRENVKTGLHFADWLLPGARSEQTIEPGQGRVVRRGLHRVAVYVDDAGQRHERSAMCPHLGCVVAWNGGEKSWDCPCHGSRFDPYGKVMTGPAHSDLAVVAPEFADAKKSATTQGEAVQDPSTARSAE